MTCQTTSQRVTELLEGGLSVGARLRVRLHLARCGHCRAHVAQVRLLVRTLRALPVQPVPAATTEALVTRFREHPRSGRLPARPWAGRWVAGLEGLLGPPGLAVGGALCLLAVLAAFLLGGA